MPRAGPNPRLSWYLKRLNTMESVPRMSAERIRVLRVITRMNIGGPAYHVSILGGRLDAQRFSTLLVHGSEGPGEASFAALARHERCRVEVVDQMQPKVRPVADFKALRQLIGVVRRFRPHIVHTHTAKAGMLGRTAAVLAGSPRPVLVHTYHGHVLEGFFGRVETRIYREVERGLARVTDRLVGVSQATVDDLVRLRVAEPSRFKVIPLGLDLERFRRPTNAGAAFRRDVGVRNGELLLTSVGRLVPTKRVDVLLRAVARLRATDTPVRLAVVGDGECRADLERLAAELSLQDSVAFVGYRQDVAPVAAAADIAALSSDSEGTPVALIEAAAAGRPAVATAVGGVADIVLHESTGLLVPARDDAALAAGLRRLVVDPELRGRMGAAAREHVLPRYSSTRLVRDIETLYEELLGTRATLNRR
jgi:glycosyltransferase involved in cell wall biosynthesis